MISICYLKMDTLMLVVLPDLSGRRLYGSAYQPIEYVFLASAIVINVVFPLVAAAYAVGDRKRFTQLYRRGAESLAAGLLIVPVLLSLIAVPLVSRAYGPAYAGAARPLQLLAIALVLMSLSAWQAFVLFAGGWQKATLLYDLGALVLSVGACLILIRAYGIDGAVLATLCTAIFVYVCSTVAIRRRLEVHLALLPMIRVFGAAASLWATLFGVERLGAPWLVLVPVALATYPAWLLAFRVLILRPSMLGMHTAGGLTRREKPPSPAEASCGPGSRGSNPDLIGQLHSAQQKTNHRLTREFGGVAVHDQPSISAILPTYNRCDVVERTLEHLLAQNYPAELIEILVCDNSSDGTPRDGRASRQAQLRRASGWWRAKSACLP